MKLKINEGIRIVILMTVFFLQFLGFIIFVNSLGSLSKQINDTQVQKADSAEQIRDYYNKKVKEIKKDVDFLGDKEGFVRINASDYVDYKSIKLEDVQIQENQQGTSNSDRVFLSR